MATFEYLLLGAFAGMLGAMVGLGGGVLIVPALTLFLKVPIHEAIAASLVGVVATSAATSFTYVRSGYANVRLGLTLELATTIGAIAGGVIGTHLSRQALRVIFGVALLAVGAYMLARRKLTTDAKSHVTDQGLLGGSYFDERSQQTITYRPKRLPLGAAGSGLAGALSGLLGIGGGPIKMPTMTVGMGIPMKAASATSNFMIGITGAASAYVYYTHSYVNPEVAVPIAFGVGGGALAGSHLASRFSSRALVTILAVVLLALSIQMTVSAFTSF